MPLRPAPLVQHDGTDNHDGARHAATRCMAPWRRDPPHLTCMLTAESLRANAPPLATLHAPGRHALLGVTAGEHAALFPQGQAAEHAGRVTSSERHDRTAGMGHRLRVVHDVPLKASQTDVRVHGSAYGERDDDTVQHVSGVTD